MDDLNGLATAIAASTDGVRACTILTRDGLVAGTHPAADDPGSRDAWRRFASLGDAERGFVQFPTEIWCCLRRGPYIAFAVCHPSVRPGVVLDQIERVLVVAEEDRADRTDVRAVSSAQSNVVPPIAKPRSSLHPGPAPIEVPVVVDATDAASAPADAAHSGALAQNDATHAATVEAPAGAATGTPSNEPTSTGQHPDITPLPMEREAPRSSVWATTPDAAEVDRAAIARELGELLQDDGPRADG